MTPPSSIKLSEDAQSLLSIIQLEFSDVAAPQKHDLGFLSDDRRQTQETHHFLVNWRCWSPPPCCEFWAYLQQEPPPDHLFILYFATGTISYSPTCLPPPFRAIMESPSPHSLLDGIKRSTFWALLIKPVIGWAACVAFMTRESVEGSPTFLKSYSVLRRATSLLHSPEIRFSQPLVIHYYEWYSSIWRH